MVDKADETIICLAHDKGRRHDFRPLKKSKVRLHPDTQAIIDSGYLGLQKRHANTSMPKKRSKKYPSTKDDRRQNRTISKQRVRALKHYRLPQEIQDYQRQIPKSKKKV